MKTIQHISVAILLLAFTGTTMAQNDNKGTGNTHNGEYIVPSPADSAGGSLSAGDKTTSGAIPVNPRQDNSNYTNSNNKAPAPDANSTMPMQTTNTTTESNTGTDNCCGGKWGLLGLVGLLGLLGLRKGNNTYTTNNS